MSFPKDWKWVKVKDVGRVETGATPSKSNAAFYSNEFPFYKPTDLSAGNNVRVASDNLSESGIKEARLLPENSILVTCIGATIGKTGIIRRAGASNQQINAIVPNETVCPDFIYYQAISPHFQEAIKKNAASTTLPILNKSKFQNLDVVLPPLSEQKRIVTKIEELFSELDAGKQELEKAAQQLKAYRQALLKWAFEGRLTNEVVGGELPDGWKWVKLGDACTSVEYGSSTKSDKSGKVPVLRMGNIQKGRFDYSDLVYTSDEDEIKKYLLKKDDVLFNRTNSAELVGKTAIYKGERPAIFAGYLIRIHRDESLLNADYLTYYLNTEAARAYGNTVRSFGVNQSNINGTKLKTYPLPLPPLEEQQRIVQEIEARLSVCDKIEGTIAESLQQAEALRQSILKKAFEGKLV